MTASPKNNLPAIILASASPRREKLMRQFNLSFEVCPSSVHERFDGNDAPADIVQMLALRKAKDIASGKAHALIIGADTIVKHREKILEKPQSPEQARAMLARLSGDVHHVLTGVALVKTDKHHTIIGEHTFYESTEVTFGKLEPDEIDRYVATGQPMDKAGAYGIQDDSGAFFVKGISGDYYNIVGLPLYALYNELKSFAPGLV